MHSVDLCRVRRACHVDGMNKSAAAGLFGVNHMTVSKMLEHAVPPGYLRKAPLVRRKLDTRKNLPETIYV